MLWTGRLSVTLLVFPTLILGHSIFWEPPSRASLGKHSNNFCNVPENHDHMSLYCGGVDAQHLDHEGKCAICGDEWGVEDRPHEVPGKYATGIIGRSYFTPGQEIDIMIDIVANHKGYFYFKLCVNNNPDQDPDQSCFDQYPLKFADGRDIWVFPLDYGKGARILEQVKLPEGVTCWQCILQWTWIAGNRWGVGPQTPFHSTEDCLNDEEGKLGCGNQETFRGCADICIGPGCPQEFCQIARPFEGDARPPTVIPTPPDMDDPDLEEYYPDGSDEPPLTLIPVTVDPPATPATPQTTAPQTPAPQTPAPQTPAPQTPAPPQPPMATTSSPDVVPIPLRPCVVSNIKDEFYSDLGHNYCEGICLGKPMYLCNLYICTCQTA